MNGRFFFSGSMGILLTWERRGLLGLGFSRWCLEYSLGFELPSWISGCCLAGWHISCSPGNLQNKNKKMIDVLYKEDKIFSWADNLI